MKFLKRPRQLVAASVASLGLALTPLATAPAAFADEVEPPTEQATAPHAAESDHNPRIGESKTPSDCVASLPEEVRAGEEARVQFADGVDAAHLDLLWQVSGGAPDWSDLTDDEWLTLEEPSGDAVEGDSFTPSKELVGQGIRVLVEYGADACATEPRAVNSAEPSPDEATPPVAATLDPEDVEDEPGKLDNPRPTIGNAKRVGNKLVINRQGTQPGVDYTYEWQVQTGPDTWQTIKTSTTSRAFTPGAKRLGKTIRVRVTRTKDGYEPVRNESIGYKINAGLLKNPKPKVNGVKRVGNRLTANRVTLQKGVKYTYRWQQQNANGTWSTIRTSSSRSITLAGKRAGKTIRVGVKRARTGYNTTKFRYSQGYKLKKGVLKKGKPTFAGNISPGARLYAYPGVWSKGTRLSYQWQACGRNIKGATGRSHVMKASNLNCRIRVKVTGRKSGYTTTSRNSGSKGIRWRVNTGNPPRLSKYKASSLSVEVNRGKQRVYVKSNGKTIYTMLTSTGREGHTTPGGRYTITARGPRFMNPDGVGANYWVRFKGPILFHSIPIDRSGNYIVSYGQMLGQRASAGCVRLSVADSIWFYNQIPDGTPVWVR